jgi:ribose transport system substrate-binding protein
MRQSLWEGSTVKSRKAKSLIFIVLAAMLVLLSACGGGNNNAGNNGGNAGDGGNAGQEQPGGKKYKLGLVAIDLANSFFVRMKEAGDVAAKDYGVEAVWQSADGSLEKQISIIENFIQQKVDVILIDPIDKNGIIPAIQKAKEAGIKVITMGNKVEGDWNYNTLYPDYENMGMVARVIGTMLGGEGEVALLTGTAGNFVSDTREQGFKDVMAKEFPNIKIVASEPTNFDTAQAQRIAETWLNTYPDLDAIAYISDSLGLAAKSAAEAKGKQLIYAGYDGDVEMHPFIEDGSVLLDVLTGAERVGYWNIAAGARLAAGAEFPTDLYMPTHFVTSDATAAALKEKGLEFVYLNPEQALDVLKGYSEELGPSVADEVISGEQQ